MASTARLMPQARYAPELSDSEQATLAALTDEQKLTLSHSIRLAIIEVRNQDLGLLKRLLVAWDTENFDMFDLTFEEARDRITVFEQWKERR